MYLYKFYSWDYESPLSLILSNEKLYTKNEFEEIVNKCFNEAKEICDNNKEILDNLDEDNIPFTNEELINMSNYSTEDDYIPKTLAILKEKYDFLELEPTYCFTFLKGGFGIESKFINKVE